MPQTRDDDKQPQNDTPPTRRRAARGAYLTLNTLLPLSESREILSRSAQPWLTTWARLKHLSQLKRAQATREPDWQTAVKESGRTPAQLERRYRLCTLLCLAFGGLTLLIALMLLFTGLTTPNAPPLAWLQAILQIIMLLCATALAMVQALKYRYRRWQVQTRRFSAAERGTFNDFWAENNGWRAALGAVVSR